MSAAEQLLSNNLSTLALAVQKKSSSGLGSSKKIDLYGIKKVRELILELAVRGKLVPQNSDDEPAAKLLEWIEAEKEKLVKEKVISRSKPLPIVSEDEKPNDLPTGWEVVRLGGITSKMGSGSTPKGGKNAYVTEGIVFLRSQNVLNEGLKLDDIAYIPVETHQKMANTKVLPGDILLNITGASLGRSTIFPEELCEANVSQHVTIIRPVESQMAQFIHLGILSPMVQRLVWGRQVGMAIEGLSKKVLEMFEFPIPPLAEQHRIVAKVDELMALCDQIEQQTEASLSAHTTLVENLLATLTNSTNAEELKQNWQRIAGHFTTLFTTEASIDQLKQTILQLAVMGKLVPQDPNDEPAAKLLERIAAEKAQLIKEGKIKKQKPLPPIGEDEKPFELPRGWEWCRLDDICHGISSGSTPPKANFHEDSGAPYLKVYNIRDQKIDFEYKPQYVDEDCHSVKLKRSILYPGDVVMNIVGPPLGKIAIIPNTYPEWNCNQAITFFRPIKPGFNRYIYTYLIAGTFLDAIELIGTAGQDNISVTKSRSILLPTPPLEEQHRIITKVSQLITLCDQIKTHLQHQQQTRLHLADAMVTQALNPVDSIETDQSARAKL
ncbi:restriction endonuclease subunit S [uncultured Endozoicomonas sp.]|uniref:restriction endonuclease subunit S n=1 Tax=uncultured Endozoicomonas sp. TaxID=432652 RepID=UPI0026376C55|nr:restriction endonuclease subunit S [uncultured Endozoicomonas sp.]